MSKRASGILLHITSLPAKYGIGDLGEQAFAFADFLAEAKQSFWQILPVNPPAINVPHSPYNCLSAFAGNPLLISPQLLYRRGFLNRTDIRNLPAFDDKKVNWRKVIPLKRKLFNTAFKNFLSAKPRPEYAEFRRQNHKWLDDYALFVTMRDLYKTGDWFAWPKELRDRNPDALPAFQSRHAKTIEKHKFLQYIFFKQYSFLKLYCNKLGIRIIGDIPIYVSYQSADVWANPQFFKLNKAKKPQFVSGTPPDCFCKTGQLWGNPIYDWQALKRDRYSWWLDRIAHNLELFDTVRIDHFRALVSYWRIPAAHKTAAKGTWVRAPKDDFFGEVLARFARSRIIVEDLGHITPAVHAFIHKHRFAGMRVLQFGLADNNPKNLHAPKNHPKNSVAYTGTHDNNTTMGWFDNEIAPQQKQTLADLLDKKFPSEKRNWQFIRLAMQSPANRAIIPMQDILGLGEEARMNLPGTVLPKNWSWRMTKKQLPPSVATKLKQTTSESQRD